MSTCNSNLCNYSIYATNVALSLLWNGKHSDSSELCNLLYNNDRVYELNLLHQKIFWDNEFSLNFVILLCWFGHSNKKSSF